MEPSFALGMALLAMFLVVVVVIMFIEWLNNRASITGLRKRFDVTCTASEGCRNTLEYRVTEKTFRVYSGVDGVNGEDWATECETVFVVELDEFTRQQTSGSLDGDVEYDSATGSQVRHTLPHSPGTLHLGIEAFSRHFAGLHEESGRQRVSFTVVAAESEHALAAGATASGDVPFGGEWSGETSHSLASARAAGVDTVVCEVFQLAGVRVEKISAAYGMRSGMTTPDAPAVPTLHVAVERGGAVLEDLGGFSVDTARMLNGPVEVGPGDDPLVVTFRFTVGAEPGWPISVMWTGALILRCPEKS